MGNKQWKRFVSAVLTVAMLANALPMSVFADGETTVSTETPTVVESQTANEGESSTVYAWSDAQGNTLESLSAAAGDGVSVIICPVADGVADLSNAVVVDPSYASAHDADGNAVEGITFGDGTYNGYNSLRIMPDMNVTPGDYTVSYTTEDQSINLSLTLTVTEYIAPITEGYSWTDADGNAITSITAAVGETFVIRFINLESGEYCWVNGSSSNIGSNATVERDSEAMTMTYTFSQAGEYTLTATKLRGGIKVEFPLTMVITESSTSEDSGDTENSGDINNAYNADLVLGKLVNREVDTWNYLNTQSDGGIEVLTQLVDGLLESNSKGQLQPSMAESWNTNDGGKTWTFTLREGVKWVDVNGNEMADVDAQDFATAMEWVLNYYKNQGANTAMTIDMVEGAYEYYSYTKGLTEEEALALTAGTDSVFMETVGIAVNSATELVYTCTEEKPYFDTICDTVAFCPMDQELIDTLGVDGVQNMNNSDMWYNGPYTCTEYVDSSYKIFSKNNAYWDSTCTLFDTAAFVYVDSTDAIYELFQNGLVDYADLTQTTLDEIRNDSTHEYYDNLVPGKDKPYSYQIIFNYNKLDADGNTDENWNKAVANTAFRQSIYYGFDMTNFYARTDAIDPLSCESNTNTGKGMVYTTDGTDYVELVKEKLGLGDYNGETMVRLDSTKAEELKAQAMEELTALGVTFPVGLNYYVSASNTSARETAEVLKEALESSLGSDYVCLNICEYTSSLSKEVRDTKIASFFINGWGLDFADPINNLGQYLINDSGAYYSNYYTNINDLTEEDWSSDLLATYNTYTDMVRSADAITADRDVRYDAFADAEAYLIEQALVIPVYYSHSYCVTKVDLDSQSTKMKNWVLYDEPMTGVDLSEQGSSTETPVFTDNGNSLSLEGKVSVNFYYAFNDVVLADEGAYVLLTMADGSTVKTYIKDVAESNGEYMFNCTMAAAQMSDTITAQVVMSDGTTSEIRSYSVQEYANNKQSSNNEALAALVKAMVNYGAAAQNYFSYNTESPANSILSEEDQALVAAVADDAVSGFDKVVSGSVEGLTANGSSLLLQGAVAIRHYFLLEDGYDINDYNFVVDGVELTPVYSDGEYYVDIVNIPSAYLDTMYTLTVNDSLSIEYSAMTYVQNKLANENSSDDLKTLCKALYLYNQAANTYFGK